ncbi:indolepyruvate oxidoreductase subunit beta family protein [Rhodobacter sp. NTK016B]|uniref:indolepyruvate oxidoreductase subunit beta family protein n=1 Tax=Rhodobacter sp. NTK016B TaxID=2759676 RepID=UPI001A9039B5|nr:indolepyruvate oxidoreductase subunit beta family protein [Rhodobacter sp. NTK016B]MBN8290646.1 indolepyruvate oxidoreductase subunit beta family protein [Rhodobacter sp. NTK016B]
MSEHPRHFTPARTDDDGLITLAILAVGGQGCGQLTDWIVAIAEANGYRAQSTSVPGVAQRTGATIYYIEMAPDTGAEAVFSLMPAPGDIDIVVSGEIMEAGRGIERGFVTPLRTTLVTSTHRVLAISEKLVPGDGRADSAVVLAALDQAANHLVAMDMERVAAENGSHITNCLLGALAGSGALPFERAAFEAAIRASGRGVGAALRAFGDAYARAQNGAEAEMPAVAETPEPGIAGPELLRREWAALAARLDALPDPARAMAGAGLRKVVDFQDLRYGALYVDCVLRGAEADRAAGGEAQGWTYATALAKHLANALCYDDIIRVADLKTRGTRFARVRAHVQADDAAVLAVTEYMHPRAEEICGLMPAALGRRIEASPRLFRLLDRMVNKGRRLRSGRLPAFVLLYGLGGLRRFRRSLWRDRVESAHREAWLTLAESRLNRDYAMAIATLEARRLIKGYSDTHSRGHSKFDVVLAGLALVEGRRDAADWARRLMDSALNTPELSAVEGTLATIRSFADDKAPA